MSELTDRFNRMKIGTKILIICLILVIVPTLIIGTVAYFTASNAINDQLDMTLNTQVNDVRAMTSNSYDLSKTKLDGDLNLLRNRFTAYGTPSITGGKIAYGSHIVNDNFQVVDSIENDMGSKATVFQKVDGKAIRVSTNVIGADGKRAIGTEISSAVYDVVITKGQTYYGTADVVGKKYVVAYEPIRNANNEIIGILFVGVPEDNVYGPLKKEILGAKLGASGYLYVMNSKGDLLIHPTSQGQNLGNEDFIKTIIANKEKVKENTDRITYIWQGKNAVAYYTYFAPLDWLIVARVDPSDFSGPVDNLRNMIIIILVLSIGAGSFIALRFGNSIARRMGDLVTLGRKVMAGDFSGAAMEIDKNERMVSGGDEIGEVSEAFTGVVNNIQRFSDEITSISTAAVQGKLTARGDAGKFEGGYATMIQGLNSTINAVVGHLDAIPVPAFIISKDFTILYANKASAAMAGSSPAEMLGSRCYDHFKTPECRTQKCASGQCMISGRMTSSETVASPRTGKKHDIAYSGVPILDGSGNAIGAMEFFTDLTDIREAARQAQKRIDDALAFINGEMGKIQNGTEQANANVEEVSAGAGQVAKNATAVSVNVEKSLESVMQVQKAMEDLSRTIQDVATRAESTAKIVHDTSDYSREGMELAKKTETGMQGITKSSNDVNQIILEIKGQMDKISEIVSLITDLANQTNLLALNAAIEAARAGDAGRGFAVVASEVKSLAVESRASAERIADMIEKLQAQTNSAVDAVSASTAGVREGSAALQNTIASFTRIADSIEQISRNVGDVASATQEQAASVEEITASVNEVNGLMQNTAKESTDAAAASEESSAAIEQISKVIGNVTVIVDSVKKEINSFK
ncbi:MULTISPECIES: Cache 3/Cache 2 fusion domain-containing protein [unclassified Methanoregula]|uniref:Cache 3/Cache 2 fusion domain-containing protein n=1 Tax=unclassified Methanoregula TaxID=2649730 RepID=UPI0009C9C018|nr:MULTISPECIES: Cache 3/Cache 2 fusion domain-containing protein [unclassified Methanoregula]OPX65214.1 MAG: Sensory rhodopsin I transducer [Methanoregula sp. PtaB.Bin085]OPY32123.1 MAG: Sensory rhodopsin I transducer [Methanoregula sp. PtaU1.Bin006]